MTAPVSDRTGDRTWVRLDNASNIFLAARNEVDTKVFRLTADLDELIDPELLQQALDLVYAQYPLFRAVLRHGIFWYYLQQSSLHPQVGEDVLPSVTHIYRSDSRELLFRVLHRGNRISLEIFHALTDGTGGLWFFQDLLTAYVGLRHPDEFTNPPPGAGTAVKQEFTVDAFTHWFRSRRGKASFADEAAAPVDSAPLPKPQTAAVAVPRRRRTPGRRVVNIHGSPTPDLRSRVVELSMPVAPVLGLARAEGVSITIFLAALFLQSVRQVRQPAKHEDTMTVSVPVNLRQFFPTPSGRNFFATTRLEHTYGDDAAIGTVCMNLAEQFARQLTKEGLIGKMRRLIAFERHPVLRFFPRPVKDRVLTVVNWLNNRGITVAMSNLGRVALPEPTAQHVRGLFFHVSAARPQLCAITCGDRLTVTLTSPFVETDYHAAFVRHLSSHGIPVSVDSSRVTSEEIMAVTEQSP